MKGWMMMAISFIFIAVGLIMYPITLNGTDAILAWYYTGTTVNLTVSTKASHTALTGLAAVTGIMPLIVLLGFIAASALGGIAGYRASRGGANYMNPKNLIELAIGMVFISVCLIVFPVLLDGIAAAHELVSASTYVDSYTGVTTFLKIVPLIALAAVVLVGIVAEYFGGRQVLTGKAPPRPHFRRRRRHA